MDDSSINDDYMESKDELAADGSPSDVEAEVYSPYPFDVEKISIISKTISLSNVIRRIGRDLIRAAEIQRADGLWDDGRKSRLIESLMLRIPLPLFYAASDKDDKLTIVDGLQRISTIRQYILEKKFELKGLEYLREFENKGYDALPDNMKIRIDETELNFVIISPYSPPEIQRNIFKRLNTGGLPLTDQEIRYALYYGPTTELLKELVKTSEFVLATDKRVNDSRMVAQELVLRFFAFSLWGINGYKKDEDMDSFLTDTMQAINRLSANAEYDIASIIKDRAIENRDIHGIREKFLLAMRRSRELFNDCAFRITTPTKKMKNKNVPRTPINKSLFEVWSVLLSNMLESQFNTLLDKRNTLFQMLNDEFDDRASLLRRNISQDSTKVSAVRGRHDTIGKMVKKLVMEEISC
jgi:hypothetical protein